MSRRYPCPMILPILMIVRLCSSIALGEPALPKHITSETQAAIDRGLKYLVRTQGRDGAWRHEGHYGRYPVAMSALAGLALMMDGNTTTQGRYAPNVDRVARYLMGSTTDTGLITRGGQDARPMFGHGFTMLVLSQLYGMTESVQRQRELEQLLTRGIALTGESQSRLGGWFYTPQSTSDEGSVTITQVQALRSCRNAGLAVPKNVIDGAMNYIKTSVNSDGGIAYRAGQPGPSRPAITAAAVCCWYNAGEYENPMARRALDYAKDTIPMNPRYGGHGYYAHLYLGQAMYLAGEQEWDDYFPEVRDQLLRLQEDDGSWRDSGVGAVYGTSIALIILQLPYNQLPIMQR